MKEIFISHSSIQKEFALKLATELGPDRSIIDCADFEPAKKSAEEIKKWFDQCKIFVLMLSKEALSSKWVEFEIKLAYERFYSPKRANFIFFPIIVDENISYDSKEIPEWIKEDECFNLKLFRSPVIVSHFVMKELRELIWKSSERIRQSDNLFVGRKNELAEFETALNRKVHPHLNGVVISGRRGIGKRTFARQCIISELKESRGFEPYKMTMREKDDIENFILQLNDFLQYPKSEIEKILSASKEVKLARAVGLTNELYSHKAFIFVTDKMGCVGYDGKLAEWFRDFITHPELRKELKMFILSEIQWSSFEANKHPNIININLKMPTKDERIMLFNRCCEVFEVSDINDYEIEKIVGKLNHSPSQIINLVKEIKQHPVTKNRIIDMMIEEADNSIRNILDPFLRDKLMIDIMLVLSRFEFLSHRILHLIFPDDADKIDPILYDMIDFNIVEEFGSGDTYIRIDAAVADYMKRSRFKLGKELIQTIEEVSEDLVKGETDIDDMSTYLIEQRRTLERQIRINGKEKLNVLIPSVAIKYVIDLYYDKKYNSVVSLCKRLLHDMHNFYPQITRELSYWLALSYARQGNKSALDSALNPLNDVDRYFILGFYYRRKGDLERALDLLEKARQQLYDTNKVRRELVEVHLRMGNIDEALSLAEINYKNRPDNVFHIQAYFQCINAKPTRTADDKQLQERLMAEMEKNSAKTSSSMLIDMKKQFGAH